MLKTLLLGLRLRCPNCGVGHISDSLFHIHKSCSNCHVLFERKSGEGAGASILWLSILPIFALGLFFLLFAINPDFPLIVLLGIPAIFILVASIGFYRNIRGLWIGVIALTDGLYKEDEENTPAEAQN